MTPIPDLSGNLSHECSEKPGSLPERYHRIRQFSAELCATLQAEDCVIQSMPDVSPTRWHLAHTTWFFETFVLSQYVPGYRPHCDAYAYLFNSYYNTLGQQFPRDRRGLLSRPTMEEVWAYRAAVDTHCLELLNDLPTAERDSVEAVVELGLQHEQQHQELMLTDIKHVFSCNPLKPAYQSPRVHVTASVQPIRFLAFEKQLAQFGHIGNSFAYDNEHPRHERLVLPFRIASRLVTNGEYLEFIADGGYERPELWLSLGWHTVQQQQWEAPLYWERRGGEWREFTLRGLEVLDPAVPVCHVSYFEADAYARWQQARLPTEFEWELVASDQAIAGNFAESGGLHPSHASGGSPLEQLWGDVWEWTGSSYSPYPGYRPDSGALGEYNGKFMCNQFVLRGGSCATSIDHIRATYRNFFPPEARWQFTGIRLADDSGS